MNTDTLFACDLALPTPQPASDFERRGFEIGWDFAHYRLTPPADHLHDGHPVRQGWSAGHAVFGTRTLKATPAVRKWLQLRLSAWVRGRSFDDVQVTPRYLAAIAVAHCPITGEAMTHATGADSDASVDRVNNDAGYAAGNLAVMSVRANAAKSDSDWVDALRFARQVELGKLGTLDGLDAAQWARLGCLMSLVTPLPHDEAARLPLLVFPPPRLRVLNPVQALQVVLTRLMLASGPTPRADRIAACVPAPLRQMLYVLLNTLLARRLAAAAAAPLAAQPDAEAWRARVGRIWSDALLLRRWRRVALSLTSGQCDAVVQRLLALPGQRDAKVVLTRPMSLEQATEGWSLETRGRVEALQVLTRRQDENTRRPSIAATETVATHLPAQPAQARLWS